MTGTIRAILSFLAGAAVMWLAHQGIAGGNSTYVVAFLLFALIGLIFLGFNRVIHILERIIALLEASKR